MTEKHTPEPTSGSELFALRILDHCKNKAWFTGGDRRAIAMMIDEHQATLRAQNEKMRAAIQRCLTIGDVSLETAVNLREALK